ncbi:MAG: DinB family protein, partial [Gammaproteobacteria bacterium]
YLSVRGIEFESINVLEDKGGRDELARIGARSIPVVSRGDEFVFAQVIADVVGFLDLEDDTAPELSPSKLAERYDGILETACRLVRAMPDEHLARELPNRPRSWRVLMHHLFQIPTAFLDLEETGESLNYESLVAAPPDDIQSSAQIADFGEAVRDRFNTWWDSAKGEDFSGQVPTYFGGTTRHEMLERTVWHSTQHTRQVASLLEQVGISPDQPLTMADIEGLPLTEVVWDE